MDSTGITNVLVLMDVIIVTGLYREMWKDQDVLKTKLPKSIADMKPSKTRLPSDYFTKSKENFEHIRSCAPNEAEGKEVRDKHEWILFIKMVWRQYRRVRNPAKESADRNIGKLSQRRIR